MKSGKHKTAKDHPPITNVINETENNAEKEATNKNEVPDIQHEHELCDESGVIEPKDEACAQIEGSTVEYHNTIRKRPKDGSAESKEPASENETVVGDETQAGNVGGDL